MGDTLKIPILKLRKKHPPAIGWSDANLQLTSEEMMDLLSSFTSSPIQFADLSDELKSHGYRQINLPGTAKWVWLLK